MKKSTGIIMGIAALVFISTIVIGVLYMFVSRDTNETVENTPNVSTSTTDINRTIKGIPISLFQQTEKKELDFIISNKDGFKFDMIAGITYKEFKYNGFMDYEIPYSETETYTVDTFQVKENDTGLFVETQENTQDNVFVFGAINDTDEPALFKESPLVYCSYRGNDYWSICGVNTSLSKSEVIELIGNPGRISESEEKETWEYFFYKNQHTYTLTVIFENKSETISLISINIDNSPVFLGEGTNG